MGLQKEIGRATVVFIALLCSLLSSCSDDGTPKVTKCPKGNCEAIKVQNYADAIVNEDVAFMTKKLRRSCILLKQAWAECTLLNTAKQRPTNTNHWCG